MACGGAQTVVEPDTDRHNPKRLYPLAADTVWSYDVDTGEGPPTLAISRVIAVDGARIEVSSGSAPMVYELRPEGIFRPNRGGWLLKAPVEEGATWDAGGGSRAEVGSVDLKVSTLAGDFRGCVEVRETGGTGDKSVRTVYCPDVGPVEVESAMSMKLSGQEASVKARLRGFALRGM
jgi:hypothetical protein